MIRHWTPPDGYDLRRNLWVLARGPYDPAFRAEPGGAVWRTSRTPQGPGTLRLASEVGGRIRAEGWGPGADWLLDRLPTLLGGDDDPTPFAPRHEPLRLAERRHPGLRLLRTGLVLESLIPAILEQKVTSEEAYRAWRRLLQRHGEPAPGPDPRLRVVPSAHGWSMIPSWEWHRAGVDGKRSDTAVRAARAANRLEEAAGMDLPQAMARLRTIPGIGPWTAAEALQRSNGAPDAISVGDLHLPRIVGYTLTGRRDTDDVSMLRLLAPYRGQRYRATRLLLLVGSAPPRRAPRFHRADIARI